MCFVSSHFFFFFFNDTATTEIYTLSLHDALPISFTEAMLRSPTTVSWTALESPRPPGSDRKSTRLNSSHEWISYAVFCLKKKKKNTTRFRDSDTEKGAACHASLVS